MLVLFDFDGTLVDSRRLILVAMGRAFTERALDPPSDTTVLATVGLQPVAMLADMRPDLDQTLRAEIAQAYRDHSIALRTEAPDMEPAFPGAAETLIRLRAAGHQLGIVTGKSAQGLSQCLAHLGWGDSFDNLQPADNAPGKPDPTLIHRALEAMTATPEDTMMIGDTTYDMIMARRAGVRAVGVAWGYHAVDDLKAAGADEVVESFEGLVGAMPRSIA